MLVQLKRANDGTNAVTDDPTTETSRKTDALRGMPLQAQQAALSPDGGDTDKAGGGGEKDKTSGDPSTDGSAWAEVVCRNFSKWDADGDGRISIGEAEKRLASKEDEGNDLIALRGLVYYMKDLAALSNDNDKSRGKHLGMSEKDLDAYSQSYPNATPKALKTLDERYVGITKKVGAEKDYGLYGKAGQPDPKLLRQGGIGTCYFLSPLIALAERDPNAICNMIEAHPVKEGETPSYTVTFPNQTPVTVTLGDAEMRMRQVSTMENGVWAAVMERAFIAHNWDKMKEKKDKRELKKGEVGAAEGGFGKDTIELLTGNSAKRIWVKGKSPQKLDELLTATFDRDAIVSCGINKQWWMAEKKRPLPDSHEYALIGYKDGQVTIRNPHGADSQGEIMTADGQTAKDGTDDGEFTIDLVTFKKMFSDLTIEQN